MLIQKCLGHCPPKASSIMLSEVRFYPLEASPSSSLSYICIGAVNNWAKEPISPPTTLWTRGLCTMDIAPWAALWDLLNIWALFNLKIHTGSFHYDRPASCIMIRLDGLMPNSVPQLHIQFPQWLHADGFYPKWSLWLPPSIFSPVWKLKVIIKTHNGYN